jgi:hypothetical protein
MKIKIVAAALVMAVFSGNSFASRPYSDKVLERECRDLAGQVLDADTPSATKAWIVTALKEALAIGAGYAAFMGAQESSKVREYATPETVYFIADPFSLSARWQNYR